MVEFLTRAGIGTLGIVDYDKVSLSNLHRQSLYEKTDIGKSKVLIVKKVLNRINPNTKVQSYNLKLNNINFKKIINKYDYVIDGSDNFKTKFLLNDFCLKYRKFLVSGAISKFDGHIFSFDFKNKDRVAQMVLVPISKIDFEEVGDLPSSIRGKGRFGSTGK